MRKMTLLPVVWGLVAMTMVSGCSYKAKRLVLPTPYPEHIYQQPHQNFYALGHAGVVAFGALPHAPEAGDTAARILYGALKEAAVFRRVTPLIRAGHLPFADQLALAREQGCDLVIGGSVGYYLDGSLTQASRVDLEVTAHDVASGKMIWHAGAGEIGDPESGSDYYLFETRGKPAPPATKLVAKNMDKIVQLFKSESPVYKDMSEDMKLVTVGCHHLDAGAYEKARWHFERAMGLAPLNPMAYYHMGRFHEKTDNPTEARAMYEKVVTLNPDTILPAAPDGEGAGQPLVSLARKRLESLGAPGDP